MLKTSKFQPEARQEFSTAESASHHVNLILRIVFYSFAASAEKIFSIFHNFFDFGEVFDSEIEKFLKS